MTIKVNHKHRCRRFKKYAGTQEVPVFVGYVTKVDDSKFDGHTYFVRAVSVERFITERTLQGKTCYFFDYRFEHLKHGELYKRFPNF